MVMLDLELLLKIKMRRTKAKMTIAAKRSYGI